MRLNLIILVAALFLACSPKQNEADTVIESDTPTASTQEEEPPTTPTVEPMVVSQEEPAAVPTAALPADGPAKAQTSSSPAAVKPNIELAATSTSKVEKPDGPTISEKPSIPVAEKPERPMVVEGDSKANLITKTEPDHGIWGSLLRNFVSSIGQVNYKGIKDSQATFDNYLTELENFPPQSDWSRNQIMAYWINAYNAYTIKLIVDNYPVSSIKDIHGGDPWQVKWIKIDGATYSLNQIENEILRARYGDARIHFAVNCAAASCPPLYNRAFTADNLNSTLQRLTRKFVNNTSYNTITSERIEISKIFEWYSSDFGNVKSYINGFTEVEVGEQTSVSYKEYDWSLNGR